MKIAVVNCAATGPLESIVAMFRAVGWECRVPNDALVWHLSRELGFDSTMTVRGMCEREGTESPFPITPATVADLSSCDLFVDVKGHRNGPRLWSTYPRLKNRTLWYRINGGKPEHVVTPDKDYGDEVNPPCPVLTPNMWYGLDCLEVKELYRPPYMEAVPSVHALGRSYVCWPPFVRFDEYLPKHPRRQPWIDPLCLVHNLAGWGYARWADGCRKLGVKIYGRNSPDGLIQHDMLKALLSRALAMVHLKQNDAPGYALYEAMAAGCPLVVSERMVEKCRMHEMFVDGETCLFFDRLDEPDLTHGGADDGRIAEAVARVGALLERLRDPEFNRRIGTAGRERLKSLMWRADRDGPGLAAWLERNFPC